MKFSVYPPLNAAVAFPAIPAYEFFDASQGRAPEKCSKCDSNFPSADTIGFTGCLYVGQRKPLLLLGTFAPNAKATVLIALASSGLIKQSFSGGMGQFHLNAGFYHDVQDGSRAPESHLGESPYSQRFGRDE
jgi:hypothetical protein